MAGDVYSAPPYVGRGGWSWYTGSAAWMHRAAIESMFGLVQHGDEIEFRPCLPAAWNEAELVLSARRQDAAGAVRRAPSGASPRRGRRHAARLQPGERLRWSTLPTERRLPHRPRRPGRAGRRASAQAGVSVG